jgi:hypothetical protein
VRHADNGRTLDGLSEQLRRAKGGRENQVPGMHGNSIWLGFLGDFET